MILQYEKELVGSAAVTVEYLLSLFVSAFPLCSEDEAGVTVVERPPLEIGFFQTNLLAFLKKLVLLHDLLLNVTHLKQVLALFRLQGLFELLLFDQRSRVDQ